MSASAPTTNRRPARRDERGVTLVELMIAVVLFALLAAGALAAFSGQQATATAQSRAVSALDGARATINGLSRLLRAVRGGMVDGKVVLNRTADIPSGITNCGGNAVPVVHVKDSSSGPDELTFVVPDSKAWGTLMQTHGPTDSNLRMRTSDGALPAMSSGDFVLLTNFSDGGVLFKLSAAPVLGAPCSADVCLQHAAADPVAWASPPAPSSFSAGAFVIRAKFRTYAVETTTFGASQPALSVTNHATGAREPAATGIEDFQVALWIDLNDDGVMQEVGVAANDDEIVYNVAGESVASTPGLSDACDLSKLRAIRLSIVARSSSEDQSAVLSRPPLEDRPGGSADGYYRVTLRTTVAPRN